MEMTCYLILRIICESFSLLCKKHFLQEEQDFYKIFERFSDQTFTFVPSEALSESESPSVKSTFLTLTPSRNPIDSSVNL